MANNTIYPFGQGGQLPSSIAIADDLVTERVDMALSAKQGVVLDGKFKDMVAYSERNYYNGKSLNYDGTLRSDLMDFCVTDKIPVQTGDTVYWRYNVGANTSKLVLVLFNSDGGRITYWTGTTSYARTITIEQENAAYIMCSFPFAQFANAYVNVNGVRAYTPSEQSVGSVSELQLCRDAQLSGGKFVKKIDVTWHQGQYFNTSGEKGESANYGYSDPIKLPSHYGIFLEVPAYTTVSVVALTDAQGNFISSEVAGQNGQAVFNYSYMNESPEDVYVVLSGIIIYNPWAAYVYDYSGTKKNDDGADVVFEGVFHGNDNSFVDLSFPVRAGDYLHLGFPDGDWVTNRHANKYTKISFSQFDANGTSIGTTTLAYESWEVPDYGYDIYVSPQSASGVAIASVTVYIRAKKDVDVPMVVTRLSKETIKPYFELEMTDTIRKVRAFQTNPCLTLALCTDLHYRDIDDGTVPFAPYSPLGMCLNIAELSKRIRIDNVVCMGDQIDGYWSAEWAQRDSSDIFSFFNKAKAPLLDTIGNHDDNRYFANGSGDRKLTPGEQYSYFIQPVDERAVLSTTMNGCNYYRDVERSKIRLIVPIGVNLNGGYAYTNDTVSWFADVLDSMPQGYKAMVFTHEHFLGAQGWSDNITGGSRMAEVIASNIDKVICVFFGHTHVDNVWLSPYVGINVAAQKVYNAERESVDGKNNPMGESAPEDSWWPLRSVGDSRENLWDVVSVDTLNSVLACFRFGAGVDRFIHYAPVSVTAGGSVTLTPSFVTATSWHVRASESASIGISDGVVTVDSSAVSGSRLTARAEDADGNYEYWIVKVVTD